MIKGVELIINAIVLKFGDEYFLAEANCGLAIITVHNDKDGNDNVFVVMMET